MRNGCMMPLVRNWASESVFCNAGLFHTKNSGMLEVLKSEKNRVILAWKWESSQLLESVKKLNGILYQGGVRALRAPLGLNGPDPTGVMSFSSCLIFLSSKATDMHVALNTIKRDLNPWSDFSGWLWTCVFIMDLSGSHGVVLAADYHHRTTTWPTHWLSRLTSAPPCHHKLFW